MQIYNIFLNPNASDLFLFPNKKFLRNILEHKDTKPQSSLGQKTLRLRVFALRVK